MKILEIRTLTGPNLFHHKAVLVMKMDLQDMADVASSERPEFCERLNLLLPGLVEHHCSPGRRGGFHERLRRGTYLGHILEHIALELSELCGIGVTFGKTVYAGQKGHYNIVVRYRNDAGMKGILRASVDLVRALLRGEDFQLEPVIQKVREAVHETELGPSAQALVAAIERRQIPWRRLGSSSLIETGYGRYRRRLQTAISDQTSLIASDLVQDKELTKEVLRQHFVPVPEGTVVRDQNELREALKTLKRPWVIKPVDGHHGQGVVLELYDENQAERAFLRAQEFSRAVIIEEQHRGHDYRVLVVNGRVAAVAQRKPAHVRGDGERSISELIDVLNADPRRGEGHTAALTKIEVNEAVTTFLSQKNLSLDFVPARGEEVQLCGTANLSTGGTSIDVTSEIHASLREMCERVARVIGLDICGIDMIHSDISQPPTEGTAVIEVNAGPGLRMHQHPTVGEPRDVAGTILDMVYPPGAPFRVPIISITGTNGKTTTTRLIAHLIAKSERKVGFTTSDGIWIGDSLICKGDTTGPQSARLVLTDPTVDVAVLETARGGIMRSGLGYDWSDIGVITNIRADHIGQDGLETIEDIVHVKSLVAERVCEGGTLILNADDAQSIGLKDAPNISRTKRRLFIYSLSATNPLVEKYVREGATAFVQKGKHLLEVSSEGQWVITNVNELVYAHRGAAEFQIANTLAAIAACRAYGLIRERIAAGLKDFRTEEHNQGRANFYRVGKGYVMLDYAHNSDAILALGKMFRHWPELRTTAVVGLPGDRSDEILRDAARAAAQSFDRILLRDDYDLRDRQRGEVPLLMKEEILKIYPRKSCRIILDEVEAIESAIFELQENEVIIVLYDKLETVLEALRRYDPVPVETLPQAKADRKTSDLPEILTDSLPLTALMH